MEGRAFSEAEGFLIWDITPFPDYFNFFNVKSFSIANEWKMRIYVKKFSK